MLLLTIPRSPPKSLSKTRVAATGVKDDDSVGLEGLTLQSPIASPAVRRSGRKKIPTERLKLALEDSRSDVNENSSVLLGRLQFDDRVSDLNAKACASGVESDGSTWTPKSSPTRVSRGRPRPRALPRSKWYDVPRASGSNIKVEEPSTENDMSQRAPPSPRSISSGEYLPTTAEMIQDMMDRKAVADSADPLDNDQQTLGSGDGGDNDSEGYASWHGIDDQADVGVTDDDELSFEEDIRPMEQKKNPYWKQEAAAIQRDCYEDEYDLSDSMIDDGNVTDGDADIRSDDGAIDRQGDSDVDSMMEELSAPFDIGQLTDGSPDMSNHGSSNRSVVDHAEPVFYEDFPPINPKCNGSFRPHSKRRALPSPLANQHQLSFPRVIGQNSGVAGPSVTDEGSFAAVPVPKARVQASDITSTCSDSRSSPSPSKKRRLRPVSTSNETTVVTPAASGTTHSSLPSSSSSIPVTTASFSTLIPTVSSTLVASAPHVNFGPTPAVVASTSSVNTNAAISTPPGSSSNAPIAVANTGHPSIFAPAPAPISVTAPAASQGREPALNTSLQHPRLQAMYAALPAKARV
ncbi:hypothetical protein AAF712_011276 [Marasmius tenuissimus]|uniref:Uncharacterized protein n=1 Tax=Marasmius tenuissimus TaxID=585030 RepID=A0ABR2ZKR6_9AGAR